VGIDADSGWILTELEEGYPIPPSGIFTKNIRSGSLEFTLVAYNYAINGTVHRITRYSAFFA